MGMYADYDDYLNPNFNKKCRIHDWKNYTSEELEDIWDTFTDAQKLVIAKCLQDRADKEDWD